MFGLKSTQEQLADIREASETGVAFAHIDTCLGSFLSDHHNRDGECLFGVYVDGTTTVGDVWTGLLDEVRATGDRIPDSVSDYALDRAFLDLFDGLDRNAIFDSSLEVPSEEDDDIAGDEMCQAWFVLTWPVPDDEETAD